jgi:hypothetical protein
VQLLAALGVAAAEVDDPTVGVAHRDTLAELLQHGGEEAALLLERMLQRLVV